MKILSTILLMLSFVTSYAQTPTDNIQEMEEEKLIQVETMPEFPGGETAMNKYIVKNIEYPELAIEKGLSGRVYIRFTVTKDGSIENVTVVRGVHELLDKEAIRVIKSMPKWKPGTQAGKPVSVLFTLPISFRLD